MYVCGVYGVYVCGVYVCVVCMCMVCMCVYVYVHLSLHVYGGMGRAG